MSQHQHRRLERARENKQERETFSQPLHKKKTEQSAAASPFVRQKLQQFILRRSKDQAPPPNPYLTTALRKTDQNQDHSECVSNAPYSYYFGKDNPLRRTVSEPILKVRTKRNLIGRQNPLQRKTSAPPAVREPDTMGGSPSSALVSKWRSTADTQSINPLEPQNYGPPLSQEGWVTPHFTVHPHVLTVMTHRPLGKANSAPAYIQYTHIHTHALSFSHHIYQQHHDRALEGIQQQTDPEQVLCSSVWPISQGELYDKKSVVDESLWGSNIERQRAKDGRNNCFESSFGSSCTNQLGLQQFEEFNKPQKQFHRKFRRSLPTRLHLSHSISNKPNYSTGLVYDSQMLKHECDCGDNSIHPEHAGRIKSIWSRLHHCGLICHCELVKGRMATFEELQSVHSKEHVNLFTELSQTHLPNNSEMFRTKPCGGKGRGCDMVWNSTFSAMALKMAVGSVIELALRVAKRELRNGFAVVRPPGHHASESQTHGFSIFNSVAIAAKQLKDKLNIKKILIVDWDIHHGSGTEKIFSRDPHVLYISLHRFDDGSFFPGTGEPGMVGDEGGEGYNVNVAWSGGLDPPMRDAEYLAAFRTVVMPIAHQFSPEVVLVSAGFDAAEGHSSALGGYLVSAKCFGVLTRKLMELAEGRVVMVLEGGYDLTTLCDASQACVGALMGYEPEPIAKEELLRPPCANAVRSLKTVLHVQSQYWPSVKSMLGTEALPYVQAESRYSAESDAASALGGLTMTVPSRTRFLNEPVEHDEADSM